MTCQNIRLPYNFYNQTQTFTKRFTGHQRVVLQLFSFEIVTRLANR